MWVGDGTGTKETTVTNTGKIYLDDLTAHKSFIGAYRSDLTNWTGEFKGFIYSFYIYNEAITTGSPHDFAGSCSGCSTLGCTDVAT